MRVKSFPFDRSPKRRESIFPVTPKEAHAGSFVTRQWTPHLLTLSL